MVDRETENEKARIADLLRLLPRGRMSVLEIGARDGFHSRQLANYFSEVTALDLEKPTFKLPRVTTAAGDATKLQYPDSSFDCVFCAEVLEHIPNVEQACRELVRVARHEIIIGVPFQQDLRVGRTICRSCGKTNPQWAHVNDFDEKRLAELFPGVAIKAKSFVGSTNESTNGLATALMQMAGNPWGTYDQDETCIHCGAALVAPSEPRSLFSRVCSALAVRLNRWQTSKTPARGIWIHLLLAKNA